MVFVKFWGQRANLGPPQAHHGYVPEYRYLYVQLIG